MNRSFLLISKNERFIFTQFHQTMAVPLLIEGMVLTTYVLMMLGGGLDWSGVRSVEIWRIGDYH